MDTQLLKQDKREKPSAQWDSNPQPLDHEACTLTSVLQPLSSINIEKRHH